MMNRGYNLFLVSSFVRPFLPLSSTQYLHRHPEIFKFVQCVQLAARQSGFHCTGKPKVPHYYLLTINHYVFGSPFKSIIPPMRCEFFSWVMSNSRFIKLQCRFQRIWHSLRVSSQPFTWKKINWIGPRENIRTPLQKRITCSFWFICFCCIYVLPSFQPCFFISLSANVSGIWTIGSHILSFSLWSLILKGKVVIFICSFLIHVLARNEQWSNEKVQFKSCCTCTQYLFVCLYISQVFLHILVCLNELYHCIGISTCKEMPEPNQK